MKTTMRFGWTTVSLLALAFGCGGRYDIGEPGGGAGEPGSGGSSSAGTGGTAGTAASGADATGGSSTAGTSAGGSDASGGSSTAGSSGSSGTAGSSGTTGSGGAGAGGSSGTAGSGGDAGGPAGTGGGSVYGPDPLSENPTCGIGGSPGFAYSSFASAAVVLDRLSRMVNASTDAPAPSSSDRVTPAWAAGQLTSMLEAAQAANEPPAGVTRFLSGWLAAGDDATAREVAKEGAARFDQADATFPSLVIPADGSILFAEPALNRVRAAISTRGSWLFTALFCEAIPPEPLGTMPITGSSTQTRRQTLQAATAAPTCTACHNLIDPLGFSLEGYDPVTGEPRTTDENGFTLDTSGTFTSPESVSYTFAAIGDLAPVLVDSCEVARCFARSFAADATAAAGVRDLTDAELETVVYAYAASGFSLWELARAVARSPSFLE